MGTSDKVECLKNIQENNKYTQAYKTFFYQGLEMIKNVLWDKVSSERAEVHNPDKTILLTGELEKNNMKVNISMKHVRGNVKFNRVMIPRVVRDLKILHPYRLQHHMVMNYAQEPLNGRNINQCKSLRKHRTWDMPES